MENKPQKVKTVAIATKVPPALAEKIKAAAAEKERSIMWWLKDLLTKHFKNLEGEKK